MKEPFSPRKEKISLVGILIGLIVYYILFIPVWHYGSRLHYIFAFLIPLLLIPIISAFISSYQTRNVFDGIIGVVISGTIVILLYISSFGGLFLKRLLYPAELNQNESWNLFVLGMGFLFVVLPIAFISLGGAFLGSKLAIIISEKRDIVSEEISFS